MWDDYRGDLARNRVAWLIGIVAAAAVVGGGWYWYSSRSSVPPPPVAPPAPPAAAATEPPVANPMPAEAGAAALPALNDSDALVRASIAGVIGRSAAAQFLVPQNIVRHIVATVDNLPRHKLAVEVRPVKPTAGETVTSTQGDLTVLSAANFARYSPLVKVVQGTDVQALAGAYQHLYPLFQQAYEDLGYPGKYFNDRLVATIDQLLETPELPTPIPLQQGKVFWEYADASLESRSAGQKLLIRMGPDNARLIKAKLRELRARIVKKD
jgi:hypothetical protein